MQNGEASNNSFAAAFSAQIDANTRLFFALANGILRKHIMVLDVADGLPALLSHAKVEFTSAEHAADLQNGHPDIVLVGAEQLSNSPFEQSALINQARAGSSVLIFEQSRPDRLAGFPLIHRAIPGELHWERNHPLLANLRDDDLKSWLGDLPKDVRAVQMPADEPALVVASWPLETPGSPRPGPSFSLLSTQSIGTGRIVLCQLRLQDWRVDPRTTMLIGNALDYLSTPPEPTPPPSQRIVPLIVQPASRPTIEIPPGD